VRQVTSAGDPKCSFTISRAKKRASWLAIDARDASKRRRGVGMPVGTDLDVIPVSRLRLWVITVLKGRQGSTRRCRRHGVETAFHVLEMAMATCSAGEEGREVLETSCEMGTEASSEGGGKEAVAVLVIGMAGSGKTTLLQRLAAHLHEKNTPGYVVNLDPAVKFLPYEAHVDVRDTVDYKAVMESYDLGPNGGILTSLNLFATKFDQVMELVERRKESVPYVLVDTPGQIEIFTWSASGSIITEALASTMPTVVVYIIDTPRCTNPKTFMSNMLQACSIMYKTKLPVVLVFNKVDVEDHQFALEWMNDFETYHEALEEESDYASDLSRSLSLVLDEFYRNLRTVGISAITGFGVNEFFEQVQGAADEYNQVYKPELDRRRSSMVAEEQRRKEQDLKQLAADLAPSMGNLGIANAVQPKASQENRENTQETSDDNLDSDEEE